MSKIFTLDALEAEKIQKKSVYSFGGHSVVRGGLLRAATFKLIFPRALYWEYMTLILNDHPVL